MVVLSTRILRLHLRVLVGSAIDAISHYQDVVTPLDPPPTTSTWQGTNELVDSVVEQLGDGLRDVL